MNNNSVISVCGLSPRESNMKLNELVKDSFKDRNTILYICFENTATAVFRDVIEPVQRETGLPTDEFTELHHFTIRQFPPYSVTVRTIKELIDEMPARPDVVVVDMASLLQLAIDDHLTYRSNEWYISELAALAKECNVQVITKVHPSRRASAEIF